MINNDNPNNGKWCISPIVGWRVLDELREIPAHIIICKLAVTTLRIKSIAKLIKLK